MSQCWTTLEVTSVVWCNCNIPQISNSDCHELMIFFCPENFSADMDISQQFERALEGMEWGEVGVHTHWRDQWSVDATSATGSQPAPPGNVPSGKNWMWQRGEEVFFCWNVHSQNTSWSSNPPPLHPTPKPHTASFCLWVCGLNSWKSMCLHLKSVSILGIDLVIVNITFAIVTTRRLVNCSSSNQLPNCIVPSSSVCPPTLYLHSRSISCILLDICRSQ